MNEYEYKTGPHNNMSVHMIVHTKKNDSQAFSF